DPSRRGDLPRWLDARGRGRLRQRSEPRSADGPFGAFLFGTVSDGFPEAQHYRAAYARGVGDHWSGSGASGRIRRVVRTWPLGLGAVVGFEQGEVMGQSTNRLCRIDIDDSALPPPTPEMEQDRRVAVFDLLEDNSFSLPGRDGQDVPPGPYALALAVRER